MELTSSDAMNVKAEGLAVVVSADQGERRLDSNREEPQMPLWGWVLRTGGLAHPDPWTSARPSPQVPAEVG